jgi:ABC-type phosphate/phosphonate transport system substrate-binding protein
MPLYDFPETRPGRNAFWQAIRAELMRNGIDQLPEGLDFWRPPVPERIEPEVIFSQVCGYPLQTIFRGQATILGTPIYDVEHCDGPTHVGAFVVHRDAPYRRLEDLRGCRFVYNSRHSNSGMNLPRRAIADIARGAPFFGSIVETHSQHGNLDRVAQREADATCVDNVTYAYFVRSRPDAASVTRILAVTPPSPSIPFVTSSATDSATTACLRRALRRVAVAPEWADLRAGLLLRDIVTVDEAVYSAVLDYEREAAERGYPELR